MCWLHQHLAIRESSWKQANLGTKNLHFSPVRSMSESYGSVLNSNKYKLCGNDHIYNVYRDTHSANTSIPGFLIQNSHRGAGPAMSPLQTAV